MVSLRPHEWNGSEDCFCVTVGAFPHFDVVTKRRLVSDIAKTFDVLGWFSPSIIKVKIFLQRLWQSKIGLDDPSPTDMQCVLGCRGRRAGAGRCPTFSAGRNVLPLMLVCSATSTLTRLGSCGRTLP